MEQIRAQSEADRESERQPNQRRTHLVPLPQVGVSIIIIMAIINPRRACAERVTVVVLCVCISVTHTLFWQYA